MLRVVHGYAALVRGLGTCLVVQSDPCDHGTAYFFSGCTWYAASSGGDRDRSGANYMARLYKFTNTRTLLVRDVTRVMAVIGERE